mmetsp:Transcript_20794/g.67341  ORF Transcript_20794/g.67341 Transcript_20794/m.67341 type:complete len:292 (-) Transcript_20794:229-1104(-)
MCVVIRVCLILRVSCAHVAFVSCSFCLYRVRSVGHTGTRQDVREKGRKREKEQDSDEAEECVQLHQATVSETDLSAVMQNGGGLISYETLPPPSPAYAHAERSDDGVGRILPAAVASRRKNPGHLPVRILFKARVRVHQPEPLQVGEEARGEHPAVHHVACTHFDRVCAVLQITVDLQRNWAAAPHTALANLQPCNALLGTPAGLEVDNAGGVEARELLHTEQGRVEPVGERPVVVHRSHRDEALAQQLREVEVGDARLHILPERRLDAHVVHEVPWCATTKRQLRYKIFR